MTNHLDSRLCGRPEPEGNAEADSEPCLLCDVLDDSFKSVQDHIDGVRDRENEVGLDVPDFIDEDEPDVNNSTHTTQVCSVKLKLKTQSIIFSYSRFLMMGQLSISTRPQ